MSTAVTHTQAAEPAAAFAHFEARLRHETDCDDVAAAIAAGDVDFTIVDARNQAAYDAGHVPGAVHLARPFSAGDVAAVRPGLLVVYCWGPGCNGAIKAAAELARMGRHVKEMLGGFEYWVREGHPVEGRDSLALTGAVDVAGLVRLRGTISCLC